MESVALLALPSAAILALLILHSARTLPRRRAVLFWSWVTLYGLVRGAALHWVTSHGLGAAFPYVIHRPMLPLFGVPLQEVAGWAIAIYLAWWFGHRFASRDAGGEPRLFPQVAWACLTLGTISWAVECAAVAAGWWHWTVPVSPLLMNVPLIGLIDWFFVGIDFLLPFVVLTAQPPNRSPARFLTLLAFPIHFGAHCFVARWGSFPIPSYHLVHWLLLVTLFWLATRARTIDRSFTADAWPESWLLLAGLAVILLDAAGVALAARAPELVVSLLPAIACALHPLRPAMAAGLGVAGLLAAVRLPATLLAAVPPAAAHVIGWSRRAPWRTALVVGLAVLSGLVLHTTAARRERDLVARLDRALAARDRGDLPAAKLALESAREAHPGSHVPPALLGEIFYKTDQLARARELFEQVVRIRQDDRPAFRHLAVIDLRLGRSENAARWARLGLQRAPEDLELTYLLARATGGPRDEILRTVGTLHAPEEARSLASLAHEVGDIDSANAILDRALILWPDQPWFYRTRIRLALARGDRPTASRIAADWSARMPDDPEAREASASMQRSP